MDPKSVGECALPTLTYVILAIHDRRLREVRGRGERHRDKGDRGGGGGGCVCRLVDFIMFIRTDFPRTHYIHTVHVYRTTST